MNINFMINKEFVRKNYDKFASEDFSINQIVARYHLIFGKPASYCGFDFSEYEKDDTKTFDFLNNYLLEDGYIIFQKFAVLELSEDDFKNDLSGIFYVNQQREILVYYNKNTISFAYGNDTKVSENYFKDIFTLLSVNCLSIKEKHKSLGFIVCPKDDYIVKTIDINITNEYDCDKFYNDDFKTAAQKIEKFISGEKSGLVILHGESGTGKTSFIKHLIASYDKKFIYMPASFCALMTDFSSFELMKNHLKNSVVIIEDCDKILEDRNFGALSKCLSNILNISDGLLSDVLNVKFICTFSSDAAEIDKALLRKGRLVEKYEFKKLSAEKSAKLIKEFYAVDLDEAKPMSLAEIFYYDSDNHGFHEPKKPKVGFN